VRPDDRLRGQRQRVEQTLSIPLVGRSYLPLFSQKVRRL